MSSKLIAPTVVIENFYPCIEGGRHPIKRVVGESLDVWVDIFKDGHDTLFSVIKSRRVGQQRWAEAPMKAVEGERWHGVCVFESIGRWEYAVEAWADDFRSWKKSFKVRVEADDPDTPVEALEGAKLLRQAGRRARAAGPAEMATQLEDCAELLESMPSAGLMEIIQSEELQALMDRFPDRRLATESPPLPVLVERERARFSAWYEFFPRAAEGRADKHSTFRDCLPRLDDAAAMGFDVIYFPPIHPIGVAFRKGKNNTLTAGPDDVGSPWAIGSAAGGHREIEPALGTEADFIWLLEEARKRGMEIALDFAINCSPDHPYVQDHPDWFYQRVDGSIRYAENPPKKYQDIYPINFHCADWKALWRELISVVIHWVDLGVKIFRVDNPHTKPVAFWEELIRTVHRHDPAVLFLSEAFTKPKMMQALGKVGFTQSYTYFTWRETKQELCDYVSELTQSEMRWYFRGNFWPNTPDILPGHLQNAPATHFRLRAALAATLSSNWGIYSGYELCESEPYPGKEEYNHSEKYELKERDWNEPGNIKAFITEINRVRRDNAAMHLYDNLHFHHAEHDQMLCYSRSTPDFRNRLLFVISLNTDAPVESTLHLNLSALGLGENEPFTVHDLLHGNRYNWRGSANYVALRPDGVALHFFRIESLDR